MLGSVAPVAMKLHGTLQKQNWPAVIISPTALSKTISGLRTIVHSDSIFGRLCCPSNELPARRLSLDVVIIVILLRISIEDFIY
jgi:hypothetical protein